MDDLLRSVMGSRAPDSVAIEERVVPGHCALADAGLYEGALLSAGPVTVTHGDPAPPSGYELVIVAGSGAGTAFALPVGRSSVGREDATTFVLADPAVSREHCVIELDASGSCTVSDTGSANGTFVDGKRVKNDAVAIPAGAIIEVGSFGLAVRAISDADRPVALNLRRQVGPGGTTPFNRPPRSAAASGAKPFVVPKEPGEPAKPHFSVASTVGPLVMAIVMIGVTRNPQYALFMLLTPIIAMGGYAESRRRASKGGQRSRSDYELELSEFGRRLRDTGEAERARLREICPDTAEALRRATLPSIRLWERRPRDEDFLRLSAGLADLAWQPPIKDTAADLPEESARLLESSRLRVAPACVDLSSGGVVGIVGDRDVALAAARNLVCQAAVHHGPADLTIAVFVDPGRAPDWDWCKWLPHTRGSAGGDGQRWMSDRREHSDVLLRQLVAGGGTGTVLAVLDSDVLTEGNNAPARDLLRAGADARNATRSRDRVAVAGIVIATSTDRLHFACNTVIQIDSAGGDATMRRPEKGKKATNELLLAGLALASRRRLRARPCALRGPGAQARRCGPARQRAPAGSARTGAHRRAVDPQPLAARRA